MEITPLHDEDRQFPDLLLGGWNLRQATQPPRAEGMHVSVIINNMALTAGISTNKPIDADSVMRMTMGFVWEDIVGDYLATFFHQITQIPAERDNIHGTLDAYDTIAHEVHEYKATWKGEDKAIQDAWRWYTQIKAYCLMTNVTSAKLRVLHLCPYPRPRTYKLVFTQQELNENWQAILQHNDYMLNRKPAA